MAKLSATSSRPFDGGRSTAIGVAVIVGAGVLYAALMMLRLSPVGPVLAGLGYVALAGWLHADFASWVHKLPTQLRLHSTPVTPAASVTLLLAVPLLATILSARRWRRWASPRADEALDYGSPGTTQPLPDRTDSLYSAAPAYPTSPALGYSTPISGPPAPSYASATDDPPPSTETTTALPGSGTATQTRVAAPSESPVWPVREDTSGA